MSSLPSYERALVRALPVAKKHQEDLLRLCIEENRATEFGKVHGFADIRDASAFRKNVPIRDIGGYAEWFERVRPNEGGVLTAEAPLLFLSSSGTTGLAKRFPATPTFLRECYLPFLAAALEQACGLRDDLRRPDAILNFRYDVAPRSSSGPSTALGLSQVDFLKLFPGVAPVEPGADAPWALPPPHVVDQLERIYYRLRIAAEHDLRMMVGINPAIFAAIPGLLARWAPRIIREVHDGTVLGAAARPPNPTRAKELEHLQSYFGTLRPLHVWPRFSRLFGWTSGVATLYLDRVRQAFGHDVDMISCAIGATETPLALPIDRHPTAGILTILSAFYEFVPASEDIGPDVPTLLQDELEVGGEYHVIVTHRGGLYRYALGDVLHVVDRVDGVPRVEYAGRRVRASGSTDLRVTELALLKALTAALRPWKLSIHNFTCCPPGAGAEGYVYVIDPERSWDASERQAVGLELDAQLRALSPAYRRARDRDELAPASIRMVEPGTFLERWIHRVESGNRPAQTKDRILQPDAALLEELGSQRALVDDAR